MAINFTLSNVYGVDRHDDPLDRTSVGYDGTLSHEELFEQNRGIWHLGPRAYDERYATFSFDGRIVFVAQIDDIEVKPWSNPRGRRDKKAIVGQVLRAGNPVHDFFAGRLVERHRNPVSYIDDPERPAPEARRCACGCGTLIEAPRHFAPGHDQRAVHERIAGQWGDTLGFIQWFDDTYGRKAT